MSFNATQRYRKTPKGVLTNIYDHQRRRCKQYGYSLLYSLEEFQMHFINDQHYLELFGKWEQCGYKYYDKPSVDRINPDLDYSFNNIQMITWEENRKKGDIENSQRIT